MTTVEEAQAALVSARDTLFPSGQWEDLFNTLHEPYTAAVLTGHDQGEMAFYLGEACLYTHRPEATTYLTDAYHNASTDFSAWAEDELNKLHPQAAADPAADGQQAAADGGQAADAHPAEAQPAVDVSSHPDLHLNSPLPDWVAHAQAKLAHLQYYSGRVDGYFGPITDAAVKHIQGAYGMPADGIIGQALWLALETHAPGVTGHPDGSAHQPGGAAHATDPGHGHAADPNAGTVTMPEDSIQGTHPAPEQHWNPETPSLGAPPHEQPIDSEAGEIEISYPIKIDKNFGPVTVKEVPIKASGKVSSEKGKYVALTLSDGKKIGGDNKVALKIDTASVKLFEGDSWKISLKGSAEISSSGGISGTLEFANGHFVAEVKFTLAKLDKGKYKFAEVTPSAGGKIADEPVHVEGVGLGYLTGKASIGVTLTPNLAWFAEKGLEATEEATEVVAGGAEVAAGGAEATAAGAETAEVLETGVGAVGGGELIIAGGFVAAAAAVLYVGYANMKDIEALKQLRTDADKAVDDFGKGFVAAWTKQAAPGGYWGTAGANAGQKQFDADVHGFEELMKQRHPGQTMDAATLEEVKKMWHETAAQKSGAFESVAEAMFGKMVRTAIYQAWLKANSDSSLPGDITETAKNYAGITGGGSTQPDVMAGQAAAKNANIQINIDNWQHAVDE